MLDKTVPYYDIIMKRNKGTLIPKVNCPPGYHFVFYKEKDEYAWAEIETAVGEFDSIQDAISYFNSRYLPEIEDLKKRLLFIEDKNHKKLGTFNIWWEDTGEPSVHWVGLITEVQGKGLGKALIFKGLEVSIQLLGDVDIYLHTQTWSYKAIGIYEQAGFHFLEKETYGYYKNDYEKAKSILEKKILRRK